MKLFSRIICSISICCLFALSTQAQKDTFSVQYPELFRGLDSLGVVNFDNTQIFENCFMGRSNELIIGVKEQYPAIGRPYFCNIEHKWYVTYSGTGLVFELIDHFQKAIRIDHSQMQGFNYQQFVFLHPYQKYIYSMGGYGYWNFNGTLRSFSYTDKTWDFDQLVWPETEPVVTNPINFLQADYIENQGIYLGKISKRSNKPNESIITKECYLIQPNYGVKYIGLINDQLADKLYLCQCAEGILVYGEVELYFVDFVSNTYWKLKANLAKNLQSSIRRSNLEETFYLSKHNICVFNIQTKQWTKTVLKPSDWEKMDDPVYYPDHKANYVLWISLLAALIVLVFFVFWYKQQQKKRITATQDEMLAVADEQQLHEDVPEPKAQTYWFTQLSETERDLLLTIIKQDNKASIDQINRILGVQDKNVSVQKFHRHKIINDLNNSYALVYACSADLIVRTKSEEDKRIFNYSINEAYLEDIKIGCSPSL